MGLSVNGYNPLSMHHLIQAVKTVRNQRPREGADYARPVIGVVQRNMSLIEKHAEERKHN